MQLEDEETGKGRLFTGRGNRMNKGREAQSNVLCVEEL